MSFYPRMVQSEDLYAVFMTTALQGYLPAAGGGVAGVARWRGGELEPAVGDWK